MKKIVKTLIEKFLRAWPSVALAGRWPNYPNISLMRKLHKIHLSTKQLKTIATTVQKKAPCKLLVFGLGNDSVFWSSINRNGTTVFIEDNPLWFRKITGRSKDLKVFVVDYKTQRKDWKILLESPSMLHMTLSDEVETVRWDVILIDAPEGWNDESPGRMKSICLSSRLIGDSGDIFVHDCNRDVEDVYCNTFLKKENLVREIDAPNGLLRHYKIISCST